MIDLREYKRNVGVSKNKYVAEWLEKELIPGAKRAPDLENTMFPNSARRPYRGRGRIKANANANVLRTHIVKAALRREYFSRKMCFASEAEFRWLVDELVATNLIRVRVEEGITYFDSTCLSEKYLNCSFNNLRQFVLDAINAAAKGVAAACLDRVS